MAYYGNLLDNIQTFHRIVYSLDKKFTSQFAQTEYDGAFPRDLTGGQMGCRRDFSPCTPVIEALQQRLGLLMFWSPRCFELLGIDVMLDAKMKPYLIEAFGTLFVCCLYFSCIVLYPFVWLGELGFEGKSPSKLYMRLSLGWRYQAVLDLLKHRSQPKHPWQAVPCRKKLNV